MILPENPYMKVQEHTDEKCFFTILQAFLRNKQLKLKTKPSLGISKSITEDPRYNDSVCYQRFCCKIKFAVIKKLDMDPSKP